MTVCALAGAFIGYATNWLAIRMLFRPRLRRTIGPFVLHGMIPARRKVLAEKIAHVVESELISHRDVSAVLDSEKVRDRITSACGERIDLVIKEKLYTYGAMLSSIMPFEAITAKIKEIFIEQITGILPEVIETFKDDLEDVMDVRGMVAEKIEGFKIEKLERIVLDVAKKELRHIEILGGILGTVIGVVQFGIIRLF